MNLSIYIFSFLDKYFRKICSKIFDKIFHTTIFRQNISDENIWRSISGENILRNFPDKNISTKHFRRKYLTNNYGENIRRNIFDENIWRNIYDKNMANEIFLEKIFDKIFQLKIYRRIFMPKIFLTKYLWRKILSTKYFWRKYCRPNISEGNMRLNASSSRLATNCGAGLLRLVSLTSALRFHQKKSKALKAVNMLLKCH